MRTILIPNDKLYRLQMCSDRNDVRTEKECLRRHKCFVMVGISHRALIKCHVSHRRLEIKARRLHPTVISSTSDNIG